MNHLVPNLGSTSKCSRTGCLENIGRNALDDPLRRLMKRILREMGIARRSLDIAVPEQLAE